jgi:hypothetical protein
MPRALIDVGGGFKCREDRTAYVESQHAYNSSLTKSLLRISTQREKSYRTQRRLGPQLQLQNYRQNAVRSRRYGYLLFMLESEADDE